MQLPWDHGHYSKNCICRSGKQILADSAALSGMKYCGKQSHLVPQRLLCCPVRLLMPHMEVLFIYQMCQGMGEAMGQASLQVLGRTDYVDCAAGVEVGGEYRMG